MERYDYYENVKEDIKEYIKENYNKDDFKYLEFERLYDEMFIADSVTGNASGSYYCNTWKAEETICHNMDLLIDALEEFGYLTIDGLNEVIRNGAEWADVTIRCYVLGQVLNEVLDDLRGDE